MAHNKKLNIQYKERILKAARERVQMIYTGSPIRITPGLSNPKSQKVLDRCAADSKGPRMPGRIIPAKLSITIDGIIKAFHDKTKFKLYLPTNSALQNMPKKTPPT